MRVVMVMAGGTGGHVFPALAVAQSLQQHGYHIVWLGTRQGLEAKVIPQAGIDIEWITISGLRGKGIVRLISMPFKLMAACWQAWGAIRRWKPVLVIGMGGFVTGPGGFMSWLTRRPLLIHEQNAIAGMTNRILSKFARIVLQAFPSAFQNGTAILTGNPVRPEIAQLPTPGERFAQRSGAPIRLLILGGSLGAKALNEIVPKALAMMTQQDRPEVRHQTGHRHLDDAISGYSLADVKANVVPFIDEMANALAWADLVICRAGALTLSELTAAGVGSILVPFPYAVDDHQTANARYLSDAGAAILIQQSDLSVEWLSQQLTTLTRNHDQLLGMAKRARALAKPRATEDVVRYCQELAGG